jgi:acetoin utilization deacetylase AcuC-like enzyme
MQLHSTLITNINQCISDVASILQLRSQAELEMQALKVDLAEKKVNARRSRSTAYHAAAHDNAQDLLMSARTAAAAASNGPGPVSTAVQPAPGSHHAGRPPPSSAALRW